MINAIIVDDEEKSIVVLNRLLKAHCPEVSIVAEVDEVDKAIVAIEKYHPQLIFLDIELAGESGFDLLERIKERNFHVIFITAHSEFALKAFRFSVTDYLLKPVGIDLLKQAIEKVSKLDNTHSDATGMQTLRIPSINGMAFAYFKDIVRMEAEGAYTHIYLDNGKHYMSSYRLKQFEEHLDPSLFLRMHRSHLINIKKIKSIVNKDGLFAIMTDGTSIEVPRRNKEEFMKRVHLPY